MSDKIQEILDRLINNCNYRHNVSPKNYLIYKKESIDQAELAIKKACAEEILKQIFNDEYITQYMYAHIKPIIKQWAEGKET